MAKKQFKAESKRLLDLMINSIYTNREIFLSDRGRWEILPAENFQMGPAGETERSFRALWRNYFKAIAIEGRINPKCQSAHMPKRYRHVMTEFMADEIKSALGERTGKEP